MVSNAGRENSKQHKEKNVVTIEDSVVVIELVRGRSKMGWVELGGWK